MSHKALSYDDVTLVPRFNNITSRRDVDTRVEFGKLTLGLPILSANMDTITGVGMAKKMYELGGLGFLHRFCSIDDNVRMYCEVLNRHYTDPVVQYGVVPTGCNAVVSLGVNEDLERFHALYDVGARYFCIDVAHGHSKAVGHMVKAVKEFGDVFVVAGNVCTPEGVEYLASCGADAIKIGIGPGSVCSTRIKTGFGVPQFSAIMECRRVQCFLIADGGIKTPGDVVKAFVAGADAIMLGGMLAGTTETPNDVIRDFREVSRVVGYPPEKEYYGPGYKVFRGMASREAQEDFMGSQPEWKTAEGVEIRVEHKGPVEHVIRDIMGGLRSGMTYCGANNLKQIRERAGWREITAAGRYEGTPHGQGRL